MTETPPAPDMPGSLFAAHHAMAAEIAARAVFRESASREAKRQQREADVAMAEAWDALQAARRALDAERGNLTLVAALDQADAAHKAARHRSTRVYRQVKSVMTMLLEESTRDTTRLSELGDQARAAQGGHRTGPSRR